MPFCIVTIVLLSLMNAELWFHASSEECLRPANTEDRLPFRDDNFDGIRGGSGSQAIITSYQFHCCGNITEWQTYVQPGGDRHNKGQYSINFQVWRPSSTVGSDGAGVYTLVGENKFPNIRFPENEPIRQSPNLSEVISVRPGDVVGIYQEGDGSDDGIQIDPDYSNSHFLWYQRNFEGSAPNTITAGADGTLTTSINAGLMLSVQMSPCSTPLLPTASPTPTPTPPSDSSQDAPYKPELIAGLGVMAVVIVLLATALVIILLKKRCSNAVKKVTTTNAAASGAQPRSSIALEDNQCYRMPKKDGTAGRHDIILTERGNSENQAGATAMEVRTNELNDYESIALNNTSMSIIEEYDYIVD